MAAHLPAVDRDVIVVGGSAGALTALQQILHGLSNPFPAAILVVIHQSESQPGRLPQVLSRSGPLPAEHVIDGATIELGRIYIAPPDFHLLLDHGRMRLSRGPKENRFRPAIDPLFRTAARAYGPQVIGVILSGMLDDGTLGMMRIKQFGGTAVAQDPADAQAGDMPASVIRNVRCDHILPAEEIAGVLTRLVREPRQGIPEPVATAGRSGQGGAPENTQDIPSETGDSAERGDKALASGRLGGTASGLTCPQCGGGVWEKSEGNLMTYRCHVGHAYTADAITADRDSHLEATLWEAARMFQESAALHRRMARRAMETGEGEMGRRYAERADEQESRTEVVRKLLLRE